MHFLIQELKQYHSDKASHLTKLQQTVQWFVENDYPKELAVELKERFQPFQGDAERVHHHNEELILRELRATEAPIHRRVDEIDADHLALDRIVAGISQKMQRLPDATDAVCNDVLHFIRNYDDHAAGEESIFFPIADQYLVDRHWLRIEKDWGRP